MGAASGQGEFCGRSMRCWRARIACALVLTMLLVLPRAALAETRVALVIGNSSYAAGVLPNPRSDAELMAKTLSGVGFAVTRLFDADQATMKKAILEFGRKLRGSDSVGLFYYAGHGVEVGGENFLIPIGADIKDEEEVAIAAINLGELLKVMERASSRINIAILDACRDNPFASPTRSLAGGLAPVSAPTGTLIAYATAPKSVALDGKSGHSPYTSALSAAIPAPGIAIEEVFRRTRRKVLEVTNGGQTPWEHSSLTGEFLFVPKSAAQETSERTADEERLPAVRLREIAEWERIKDTKDPEALRRHIAAYPDGMFTELATLKIAKLQVKPTPWSWIVTGSLSGGGATRGQSEVLYERALKLETGTGGPEALAEAVRLYREAADMGLVAAMHNLARMYDKGRGTPRDSREAASWYRRAAHNDHPAAMSALGTMYEFGEGIGADLAEALRLYRLAAEKGDPHGLTSLGYLYAQGKGVARDRVEARRLYQAAADKGHARAMFNLALMHLRGEGGPTDAAEAVHWLKSAADLGHTGAMRELASLYDEGRGVSRDPKIAADYLLAALKAGHKEARNDVMVRPLSWSQPTRQEIQRRLGAQGLYTGPAHGIFDVKTRRALDQLGQQP